MLKYKLTQHAQDVIQEREIKLMWIEQVLEFPELTEDDVSDNSLEHRLAKIKDYGNRILRVVFNKDTNPVRVVTAYFDRKMRDRL